MAEEENWCMGLAIQYR